VIQSTDHQLGVLALVGSGEYTDSMLEIETQLVEEGMRRGKTGGYIQFATAAGEESESSIEYWKNLGKRQAEKIGVPWKFIPVLNSSNIDNPDFIRDIKGASLIYFSGGNPVHLTETFHQSELLEAIKKEFATGTSLAGCSAGAMAMAGEVSIHWRKNRSSHKGFGILPDFKIFPHYDRYFGKIPSPFRKLITHADEGQFSIGIDEDTALIWNKDKWQVSGKSSVHILNKVPDLKEKIFFEGEYLEFLGKPVI
jgi:cyanophycinase